MNIIFPTKQIQPTSFQEGLIPYYDGIVFFWWMLWIMVSMMLFFRYMYPYLVWFVLSFFSQE